MSFKITNHIAMFIFILVVGAFTAILPLFKGIPTNIGYYVMHMLIFISAVFSGLNACEDLKKMVNH